LLRFARPASPQHPSMHHTFTPSSSSSHPTRVNPHRIPRRTCKGAHPTPPSIKYRNHECHPTPHLSIQ
jgi:hypothetical protein